MKHFCSAGFSKAVLIFFYFFLIFINPVNFAFAQEEGASFQLQPGDRLDIEVFREDDITGEYEIDPAGKLTFPLVGELKAAGLKIDELRDQLIDKLKKYLINPQVSIARAEAKVKTVSSISILGHVKKPATFDFAPGTTLMRIISQAEGFAPSANKRKVRIVRIAGGSKESFVVNAQDVVDGKAEDPELQPGDMIFVPESIF